MLHDLRLGGELFARLLEMDCKIARWVASLGCQYCAGPLHQSNYRRKPRGAKIAETSEAFVLRYSLCCGREGCRRRTLPPSLRFLGRRVYVEAVVLVASVVALLLGSVRAASDAMAVPVRTLKRLGRVVDRGVPTESCVARDAVAARTNPRAMVIATVTVRAARAGIIARRQCALTRGCVRDGGTRFGILHNAVVPECVRIGEGGIV